MQSPYGKISKISTSPESVAGRLEPAPPINKPVLAFLGQARAGFPGAMGTEPVRPQERPQTESSPFTQWRGLRKTTPPSPPPLPPLPDSPSSGPSSPLSDSGSHILHALTLSRGTDDSSGASNPVPAGGLENATETSKAITLTLQAPPPPRPRQSTRSVPLLDLNESGEGGATPVFEETIVEPSLSLSTAFILDEQPTTAKPSLFNTSTKRSRYEEVESEAQGVRPEEQRKKLRADSKTPARSAVPQLAGQELMWHGVHTTKSALVKKQVSHSSMQKNSTSAYEDPPLFGDEPPEPEDYPSKRVKQVANMRKGGSGKDASFGKAYNDLGMFHWASLYPSNPLPEYQEDEDVQLGEELVESGQNSGLK